MKICIIGANGLIGKSLINRLKTRTDIEITAFARRAAPIGLGIRWIQGDLENIEDCTRAVKGQDFIIHLAHTNFPLTSDQDMVQDALLNIVPTLNLLKAIETANKTPHLIYPSSGGAVYGDQNLGRPFKEDDPCLPLNSYGIQKLMAEHYIRLAASRGTLTATILRIANIYGWLLPPDRLQGFIGTAVTRVLQGKPIRIVGNPENVRDYIHIDDVIEALLLPLFNHSNFEIYNVGSGTGYSIIDIIHIIETLNRQTIAYVVEKAEFAQYLPSASILDTNKIKRKYGWQSKINLTEGIQRMLIQINRD